MSRVRILVLTSSTGGGHDARACAFAEWVYELYGHDVDVQIEQMLEHSSSIGRAGVGLYNFIQKRVPVLHHPFYGFIEGLSIINRSSVTIGREYYISVLKSFQPHLIFSVHDCLNRGYFQLAREILGKKNVRCVTYCGEFSGGYGYSRNWVEPTADLYISRTTTAQNYAIKIGMPVSRCRVEGHFMRPRCYSEVLQGAKKDKYLKDRLRLMPDVFTVLLAAGGNGANNHMQILPRLLGLSEKLQVIVVCGKDQIAFSEVIQFRSMHKKFRCAVEGYVDDMHLLVQCSNAIFTRGGTTTCAKALNFTCPIIFNTIGGVMPQERLTVKFFQNGCQSPEISSPESTYNVFHSWCAKPELYAKHLIAFRNLRFSGNPEDMIHSIVAHGFDAAGISLNNVKA